MNPVSTRIELGCLGLMGTFWIGAPSYRPTLFYPAYTDLALGAFLASSDSETASVECFVSETNLTPIDNGCEFFTPYFLRLRAETRVVSTETYQAQYRVLEAFSLFNAILSSFVSISDPVPM
jgi:hypothetical protein